MIDAVINGANPVSRCREVFYHPVFRMIGYGGYGTGPGCYLFQKEGSIEAINRIGEFLTVQMYQIMYHYNASTQVLKGCIVMRAMDYLPFSRGRKLEVLTDGINTCGKRTNLTGKIW